MGLTTSRDTWHQKHLKPFIWITVWFSPTTWHDRKHFYYLLFYHFGSMWSPHFQITDAGDEMIKDFFLSFCFLFFFLTTDEKVIGGRMCTGLDAWLNPPFVFAIELIWAQEPEVMFIFVFHWLEEAALILMRAKYVPSCKSLHIPCHGRNSPAELQLHLGWFQGCQTDHIFNLNHHWVAVD